MVGYSNDEAHRDMNRGGGGVLKDVIGCTSFGIERVKRQDEPQENGCRRSREKKNIRERQKVSHHHRETAPIASAADSNRRCKILLHQSYPSHTLRLVRPRARQMRAGAHPPWHAIITTTTDQRGT